MSVKLDIITSRLEDLEKLVKSIAEFWGNSTNERLHIKLEIKTTEIKE